MNALERQWPSDEEDARHVLLDLQQLGVELWSERGNLNFRAPRGVLSPRDLERLRRSKRAILSLLESGTRQRLPNAPASREAVWELPLAFSQRAHWELYDLAARAAIQQLASATRLRGPLNVACLEKSLSAVIQHHDSLRTQIVLRDSTPRQVIAREGHCNLALHDLTHLAGDAQEKAALVLIEHQIMSPVDPTRDPLWAVSLVRLHPEDHLLVITMEHMISDAASVGIFLRDWLTAYHQITHDQPMELPSVELQFSAYTLRQHQELDAWQAKLPTDGAEPFSGAPRLPFAQDIKPSTRQRSGWGAIPIRIDRQMKRDLTEWCRGRRTTLVMAVFTAYVAAALRWCRVASGIFQYQVDGRSDHRVENAIGYFASTLYLRLEIHAEDTWSDLLNRVMREYCNAYEHADQSYWASQSPRPEFAKSSCFNWVPQLLGSVPSSRGHGSCELECSPVPFDHPMLRTLERDNDPVVLLFESPDEVVGAVHFSLQQLEESSMASFVDNFRRLLDHLLRDPTKPIAAVELT